MRVGSEAMLATLCDAHLVHVNHLCVFGEGTPEGCSFLNSPASGHFHVI